MSKYSNGKHAIERFPKGTHSVERYPLGQHGVAHPCTWYINREVRKRSVPAIAVLLSSSMGVGSLSVPVRAFASELQNAAQAEQTVSTGQTAPDPDRLVYEEATGLYLDPETGLRYAPGTYELVDSQTSSTTDDTEKTSTETPTAPTTDPSSSTGSSSSSSSTQTNGTSSSTAGPDASKSSSSSSSTTSQEATQAAESSAETTASEAETEDTDSSSGSSSDYTSVADDGTTLSATMTELQVAARLLDAGWTPEMIAAALGNMYAESSSNAASFCDMSGQFNYGYEVAGGLFQWTDAGSSAASLSSSGFTGLTTYAAQKGKNWTDPTLQTEYFLQTWRASWAERQTYYDSASPEYAGVDVSLASFDESRGNDFDGDGIVDARDDDVDGDGVKNDKDKATFVTENGKVVRYKSADAAKAIPTPVNMRTDAQKQQHVAELTFMFMAGYEGPSASVSHLDRRVAHAQRVYPAIVALEETHELGVTNKNSGMVIASAETMLGGSYVWGAESPAEKTFDCSGLTRWCYSLVGVDLDHYSETQYLQADKVYSIDEAVPGDILWKPGHVGIYIGNGQTVEAKGKNYGIVYGEASSFMQALHFNELDLKQIEQVQQKAQSARLQQIVKTVC